MSVDGCLSVYLEVSSINSIAALLLGSDLSQSDLGLGLGRSLVRSTGRIHTEVGLDSGLAQVEPRSWAELLLLSLDYFQWAESIINSTRYKNIYL